MKRLLCVAFLWCGCVNGVPSGSVGPSTSAVRQAMESASASARQAAKKAASARESLVVAAAKSSELLTIATPAARPLVMELKTALDTAKTELDAAQSQLDATNGALADSSGQLDVLQGRIGKLGSELAQAQEEADRMKAARDFWRACVWRLTLLALALGIWIARKPLLALCGL